MPRPMKNRDPFGERNVAARVAIERDRRGMTYEGLAKRMADAGCEIHSSALYKIEKGDPPRRITVTELLAFSKVLELPLAELVADPSTYLPRHVYELVDRASRLRLRGHRFAAEGHALLMEADELIQRAREKADGDPKVIKLVEQIVERLSETERAQRVFTGGRREFPTTAAYNHDELEHALIDFREGMPWERFPDDDEGEQS